MKRMYQLVAGAIVALVVPLVIGGSASAASVCEVGFTGPNSQNMCTSVETYSCEVSNENTVTINNANTQVGVSGAVLANVNTSAGGATSGTVSNSNGTTFSVVISNTVPGGITGGVCTAAVVVPATNVPVAQTVTPTNITTPRALPVTSGDNLFPLFATITGVVAALAILMAGAAVIYQQRRG